MNQNILHGVEIELQLMAPSEDGLKIVSAEQYLNRQYNLLPQCCTFDFGNIEIATPPRESYKEAVEIANFILTEKLIPALINDFKLEKFALFLPTPMCKFYYNEESIYRIMNKKRFYIGTEIKIVRPNDEVCCLKHWNISLNYNSNTNNLNYVDKNGFFNYDAFDKEVTKDWPYNYNSLIKKGYSVLLKDLEFADMSRVHIKIPYHYAPLNGNPDLLPNFEDILLPPERGWRNLVCYYKDNTFTSVRNLI